MSETKSPQGGLTRRNFLKATGVVAGAAALSGCTTTLSSDGSGSSGGGSAAATSSEETTFISSCRGNCGSCCPQKVTVREGKVVKVAAADYMEQDIQDRRLCVKGYAQPQRIYDPDRLKYPLRRVDGTERGAGEWERIEWDDAIAEIATQMQTAMAEHGGGTSIGFWSSYGSYGALNGAMAGYMSMAYGRMSTALGACILGAGADEAQLQEQYSMLGQSGNGFADAANAQTIFCWGGNPAEAYVHAWQFVCDARENNGAKLITIDPQFTASAMHSDLYVPIIPGTDGALMLAMANYIIENDLVDTDFMKNNTVSPYLVKEDGTYLRMSDFGVEPTEGPVSSTTGLPTTIDRPVVWDESTGASCSLEEVVDPAIEGTFDIDGVTYTTVYETVKEKIADYDLATASAICGVDEDTIAELATIYATEGPVFVMTFQGLGHHVNSHHTYKNLAFLAALTGNAGKEGASICGNPSPWTMLPFNATTFFMGMYGASFCGMYLPEVMENKSFGGVDIDLQVLWINNGNVLSCESGRLELIEAVKKVTFVVCADVCMTDSACYSDIVLPIPHAYETEDISFNCPTPYYNYFPRGIEPLYECKSDIDIMRMLASALGMDYIYYEGDDEALLRAVFDTETNLALGIGYDALSSGELVHNALYTDMSYVQEFGSDEDTRLKYYVEEPTARNSFGQEIADHEKYPYYEHANEAYKDNPLIEQYPLMGCSQHNKYHVHSQLAYTPFMRELEPEPAIKINADDAAERGIEQGDYVRAYNDHGSCVLKAVVTQGIMPGVVSIPHGFQADQFVDGHSQDLTSAYMNDFCSNSAFYDFLCEVEKYEGGE